MAMALLITRVVLTLALLAAVVAVVNSDPNMDHTSTYHKNLFQGQGPYFDGTGRPKRFAKASMVVCIVLILMMIWSKL